MRLSRRCLLVGARAAKAWPLGRSGYNWFSNDLAESRCHYPRPVLVSVARRYGDPAVAIAAYRAHCLGFDHASWILVWRVQGTLIDLLRGVGEPEYNDQLGENPDAIAMLLQELAEEVEDLKRLTP